MTKDEAKDIMIECAKSFLGRWYKWGGNNPDGFDCSGLVCEALKSIGKIGRKDDLSAQMLYDKFQKVDLPSRGCLVFWHSQADPSKVIHIEICLNDFVSIGASGGGSNTLTEQDAMRDNAFIKIRPFASRMYLKGFVDPFAGE